MIYDVYSFDFDGSLANLCFLMNEPKDIFTANQELLEIIRASRNKKVVLINSNRQAPRDDLYNAAADNRGSCYPAIQAIALNLQAIFDDFLLGDIYNDLPSGGSYKQALKYIAANKKDYKEIKGKELDSLYNWIHDESKLTTIYAQMNKLASEHPDDFFNFYFLDDRNDILDKLHAYFLQYPQMIPPNVKLHLKLYRGPTDRSGNKIAPLIVDYEPIQGTREKPDKNYRQTVKNMAAVTIEQMAQKKEDISTSKSTKGIKTYKEAKAYNFDISAVNCINHYKPGMIPVDQPEPPSLKTQKLYSNPKKTRAYKEMGAFKSKYKTGDDASLFSTSTSIAISTTQSLSKDKGLPTPELRSSKEKSALDEIVHIIGSEPKMLEKNSENSTPIELPTTTSSIGTKHNFFVFEKKKSEPKLSGLLDQHKANSEPKLSAGQSNTESSYNEELSASRAIKIITSS